MKRAVVYFLSILALLPFLSSCEKETILTVDQTSMSIPDTGGSQTITLTANKPWSASSNQSWCKVSPSAGDEAASSRISITCDANTTYDARSATVTVTCAELTKSITVSQATNNGLLVSQTSYEVTKAAQQLNIQVQANVKFSVEVDSGCKDWVKYNSTKGLTTSTVVLDIAENKTYDNREGKVTIKQDGGLLSSTITIKQSQMDGLFITTPEYNLSNEKHTLTVEVSTNVEFDVKSEAEWVKYVQTKGLSTKQIVLEVLENDTYDQRETKVNVKQKNGDLSGIITIKQDEKYGILVMNSEYDLSNEAQTIDVEVKYNVDYSVVIPDDCKDWIKQLTTKSLNSKNYQFSIAKNESYDNREGSITFKQKNGAISTTVSIKQDQTDILDVSPEQLLIDVAGGIIEVSVISNIGYDITIAEDAQEWISLIETKTVENKTICFNIEPCDDELERTGTITISKKDFSFKIAVEQFSFYAAYTNIIFADEKVKTKLVEAFDSNKDGELSIREARKAKSISGVFGESKEYDSFDEFQYFIGVSSIPENMFAEWRLTSIILPKYLRIISYGAFDGCDKLASVYIPNSVTHIVDVAFRGCTSLSEISLPESIISIGVGAFVDCKSLKEIIIPSGVTSLQGTFARCSNLSSIHLPEGLLSLRGEYKEQFPGVIYAYGCFADCISLRSIDLPDGLLDMGDFSFSGCTGLESIVIPPKISTVGGFIGCTCLKTVKMPDNVSSIYMYAFKNCSSLTSITLPSTVSEIWHGAFDSCIGLQQAILYSKTPPRLISPMELPFTNTNCPIFVPSESIDTYMTISGWNVYASRYQPITE